MSTLLFVYGTLKHASRHPMAKFLSERAAYVGPASVAARLYDLGEYPGIISARTPGDRVHGDLFDLGDRLDTLSALDEYESVEQGLFARRLTEVSCGTQPRWAWVYWYLGEVRESRFFPSGVFSVSAGGENGDEG